MFLQDWMCQMVDPKMYKLVPGRRLPTPAAAHAWACAHLPPASSRSVLPTICFTLPWWMSMHGRKRTAPGGGNAEAAAAAAAGAGGARRRRVAKAQGGRHRLAAAPSAAGDMTLERPQQ